MILYRKQKKKPMDIFHFIKSQAVCNHLKEIQHEFTSFEYAKLVYRSDAPLEKKYAAWREIIDTMPACQILDEKANRQVSLHQHLNDLIACQNSLLEKFYRQDDGTFTFTYYSFRSDRFWESMGEFSSFKEAFEAAKEDIEMWKVEVKNELYFEKKYPDSTQTLQLRTNIKGRAMEILLDGDIQEDMIEYSRTLDLLAFIPLSIPTPFKKGDILHTPHSDYEDIKFVLLDLKKKDMVTCREDEVTWELNLNSEFDFEYFREPLPSDKKELQYISDYLKNKLDLVTLINLCKFTSLEKVEEELKMRKKKLSISKSTKELYGL